MAITYIKIGSASGTGSSTDLTISGISGTYDDLIVRTSMRSAFNAQRDNLSFFINGDFTTSNYFRSEFWAEDNAYGLETRVNNNTQIATVPSATAVSNLFGAGEIYIPSYSSTGNQKIAISRLVQSNRPASNPTLWTDWNAYVRYLNNTNPITSITLRAGNGNFVTGSKIDLYGIKNA